MIYYDLQFSHSQSYKRERGDLWWRFKKEKTIKHLNPKWSCQKHKLINPKHIHYWKCTSQILSAILDP